MLLEILLLEKTFTDPSGLRVKKDVNGTLFWMPFALARSKEVAFKFVRPTALGFIRLEGVLPQPFLQ